MSCSRLLGAVEEEAGNVERVDRLDQQLDAAPSPALRREAQILDELRSEHGGSASCGAMPARQFTWPQPSALA